MSAEDRFNIFFIGSKTDQELFYIDGNISSGKSTLCKQLGSLGDDTASQDVLVIPQNEVVVFYEMGHEDGVLAEYLSHRSELSALFQVHMLSMCSAREHKASLFTQMSLPLRDKRQLVIVDRSITGNGIFALANKVFVGALSETDFGFYKKAYSQAMKHVPGEHAFAHGTLSIYLHVPVPISITRCAERDNLEEKEYSVEYFKSIERAAMVALLANLSSKDPHPQLLLDWGNTFGKMDIFYDLIKAYTALKAEGATTVPTKVTLSRDFCDPKTVSQYTSILDFSHHVSEDSFFSYENAMIMMSLLCMRCPADIMRGKHLFVRVPSTLTEKPFDGPFKLNIVEIPH